MGCVMSRTLIRFMVRAIHQPTWRSNTYHNPVNGTSWHDVENLNSLFGTPWASMGRFMDGLRIMAKLSMDRSNESPNMVDNPYRPTHPPPARYQVMVMSSISLGPLLAAVLVRDLHFFDETVNSCNTTTDSRNVVLAMNALGFYLICYLW